MCLISKKHESKDDCIPVNEKGKNIFLNENIVLNEHEAGLKRSKQF